jgi:predicted amidohydrolase
MKISLIQSDIAWNDPSENITRCQTLAKRALDEGGELLIFPEMYSCGFSAPTGLLAKESSRIGTEFLLDFAAKYGVTLVGSMPELAQDGRLYNQAIAVSPEGIIAEYRKIHLFSFGDENRHYSAGTAISQFKLKSDRHGDDGASVLRCTLFICYDLRFADLFLAQAPHTDLFIIIANWPHTRRDHWITLLKARAIETQSYVAGVNRVGSGGGLTYSGDSSLYHPDGTLVGALGDEAAILTRDIDSKNVASWRDLFPALKDRREDLYPQFRQI